MCILQDGRKLTVLKMPVLDNNRLRSGFFQLDTDGWLTGLCTRLDGVKDNHLEPEMSSDYSYGFGKVRIIRDNDSCLILLVECVQQQIAR